MNNEKPENTGEIQVRDENGRFIDGVSGNPTGKPKGTKNYLTILEEALEGEGEFFKSVAKFANRNPRVMVAVLKKFIPDKTSTEITAPEGIEFVITRQTDETTTSKSNKDI